MSRFWDNPDGPWQCRKCQRCGGMLWAVFHSHRREWRRTHPGAAKEWFR